MSLLTDAVQAQIEIGGHPILVREIVGNGFGLASAVAGMRRSVWAWPVGIVGNIALFTVFLGAAFDTPAGQNLYGQAGRQLMFVLVSAFGWYRWWSGRNRATGAAVQPRWTTRRERAGLLMAGAAGVAVLTPIFRALGSFEPVWADAWIFTGSVLATYGMARGWTDFWLVWIGVDVVGVPLLLQAGLYPSAVLYLVYGAFCLGGLLVWRRTRAATPVTGVPEAVPV